MRGVVFAGIALVSVSVATPRIPSVLAQEVSLTTPDQRGPRFYSAAPGSGAITPVEPSAVAALRRRVTFTVTGATLGQVLDTIGRTAGLRLNYSPSVVPVSLPVTIDARNLTVAAVLTEVLIDADVDVVAMPNGQFTLRKRVVQQLGAIVGRVTDAKTQSPLGGATVVVEGTRLSAATGNDGRYRIGDVAPGTYTARARYIGYAPGSASTTVSEGQEATADFALEKSAQKLDEVVTTGTLVPTQIKALPTPITVVSGEEIAERNLQRLDQLFRGDVPGSSAFDPGVLDYSSTVKIRGANTLGGTPTIKTYIDGIEVADAAFIATIDPRSVDRIEITRGPQASTIYGSDASGGVMQIFTKHGTASRRPVLSAMAAVGAIEAAYARGTPLQQTYAVGLSGGAEGFGYNLGGSYGHQGEWSPEYYSREPSVFGGGRWTQGKLTAAISARYTTKTIGASFNHAFAVFAPLTRPLYETDQVEQETYGIRLTYQATHGWRHAAFLGYDRNEYDYFNTQARFVVPSDSFLTVFTGNRRKSSFGYNTSLDLPLGTGMSGNITLGADHNFQQWTTDYTGDATRSTGSIDGTHFGYRTSTYNTGVFSQLQLGFKERLFLTAGLRGEKNDYFGPDYGVAWSPRVGASYVQPVGQASVKLRASWGNAIRPPGPGQKEASFSPFLNIVGNPLLGPERQRGWDAGADFALGPASFGVTYYDQTALNLIDFVYVDAAATPPVAQYQNVGRVHNTGWELEGSVALGKIDVKGTYSRPRSTIQELGPLYQGDYLPGDPVQSIPSEVAGGTIGVSPTANTRLIASVTYFGSWIDRDDFAFLDFAYGGAPYRGSNRAYWLRYPSITKLNLGVIQRVTRQVSGFVQVDNVGNNQRTEGSNAVVPKGRVSQAGVKVEL